MKVILELRLIGLLYCLSVKFRTNYYEADKFHMRVKKD